MPYRVEITGADPEVFDRLVELGALDAEATHDGVVAALLPDAIPESEVTALAAGRRVAVRSASGRDEGSVWILRPRPFRTGRLRIVPADQPAASGDLRLIDSGAFGTGLHPTTALCLEMLDGLLGTSGPDAMLDVGTGSGVLALAALMLGVPRADGLDIAPEALVAAAENARLNGLDARLRLTLGGPDAVTGAWPLVVANVLAAPLIELAPVLVRRVGHYGRLVLSGIPASVQPEVERVYRDLGMRTSDAESRGGWVAVVMQASW